MTNKKITTIEELKQNSRKGKIRFYSILLAGGLFTSSKEIQYNPHTKHFTVVNWIDDTKQILTEKQLFDKRYSNIGEAITKGALIVK